MKTMKVLCNAYELNCPSHLEQIHDFVCLLMLCLSYLSYVNVCSFIYLYILMVYVCASYATSIITTHHYLSTYKMNTLRSPKEIRAVIASSLHSTIVENPPLGLANVATMSTLTGFGSISLLFFHWEASLFILPDIMPATTPVIF